LQQKLEGVFPTKNKDKGHSKTFLHSAMQYSKKLRGTVPQDIGKAQKFIDILKQKLE